MNKLYGGEDIVVASVMIGVGGFAIYNGGSVTFGVIIIALGILVMGARLAIWNYDRRAE